MILTYLEFRTKINKTKNFLKLELDLLILIGSNDGRFESVKVHNKCIGFPLGLNKYAFVYSLALISR